jgi:long-chain acyl-CoA synthetase
VTDGCAVGDRTSEDVHRHCRAKVAGPKRPDKVVIMKRLPLTPVGEPDRNALAASLSSRDIRS